MRACILLITAMALFPLANAGQQTGTVQSIAVRHSDGLIYFWISGGSKSGAPSCATNTYWMIRDENSNAGKQQYAMLMAAKLTGRPVTIVGSNTCNRWVDGEDVNEILLAD